MKKYILGVDGGNTKTDYFLFDLEGNFIDFERCGTCSHEGLADSFEGSYRVMKKDLMPLLDRNNVAPGEIYSSVFGLAGVDTPYQKERLQGVIERLGFKNFEVVNDSFLGIKPISKVGVCSINGTGTSTGGIDLDGNYLQVGGIGYFTGDEAGGRWLAKRAIRQAFDSLYRFGKPTVLTDIVMKALGINDKYYFAEAISERLGKVNLHEITLAVFDNANKGDEVCIDLLKEMADNLARSTGGCVMNLNLGDNPTVILAGSVWVKGACPVLVEEFKKKINLYTKKECNVVVLRNPPATGAIIWAVELATGEYPSVEVRELISKNVKALLDKIEGKNV